MYDPDDDVPLPRRPLEVFVSSDRSTSTVDESAVIDIVTQISHDANITCGEISVAVVDDKTIHQLNRQYLDHDYATDVLSFPLDGGENWIQGEIIVSHETAAECAEQYGWPPDSELMLYIIHGALHLAGHDDKDSDRRAEMRQAERHYLKKTGITGFPAAERPVAVDPEERG